MTLRYVPPPTIEKFMLDDTLARFVVGPLGSGKSMGMIMELLRRSRMQQPDNEGVRRTRGVVVRNTMSQLRLTALEDIRLYLKDMINYFVTDSTVQIRAPMDDGSTIHADWILIPLDTKQDVQRLLSMQLSYAWINEFREVPIEVVGALIGRLGRYPPKNMGGGPTWFGLIADSNPCDVDSPYYERLVLAPETNWKLFHQPSGLSVDAENVENLPPAYYENLLSERDDGWSDVHVRSQWGSSIGGQAVFKRSFNPEKHVVDGLLVNSQRPLIIGLDFGRTPCALIGQSDPLGRVLIFEEVLSEDMGLRQFVNDRLKPRLMEEPYLGKRIFVIADPAGMQKSQLAEETAFDVLKQAGLAAYPATTNDIGRRLLAFEKLLHDFPGGDPGLQISRIGCPTLVRALSGQYRYRKKTNGQLDDKPEKLHPWSDVCFVAATPIATPTGEAPVESLRPGDLVLTHLGPRRITATGRQLVATTVAIELNSNITLRCTPEHPFCLENSWVRADNLCQGDTLTGIQWHKDNAAATSRSSWAIATTKTARTPITGVKLPDIVSTGSSVMALCRRAWSYITKTVTQPTTPWRTWSWSRLNSIWPYNALNTEAVLAAAGGPTSRPPGLGEPSQCTSQSGPTITARFLTACRSTIGIMTRPTTRSTTWNFYPSASTHAITRYGGVLPAASKILPSSPAPEQPNGIAVKRAVPGMQPMVPQCDETSTGFACSVGSPSCAASAECQTSGTAPVVAAVRPLHENVWVFNLTVEDAHTYYAGGALVHNCDAGQYLALAVNADLVGRAIARTTRRPVERKFTAAAWT